MDNVIVVNLTHMGVLPPQLKEYFNNVPSTWADLATSSNITAIDGKATDLRAACEMMHGGDLDYEIRDGRLRTDLNGSEFDVAVYKLGDRYLAARSNEFGYANYEVEPLKE